MSKGQYVCHNCGADHHDGCVNLACVVGYHNVLSKTPEEIHKNGIFDPSAENHQRHYERGMRAGRTQGRISGIAEAARHVSLLSGEAYAALKDDRALFLRQLAEELTRWMQAECDKVHQK